MTCKLQINTGVTLRSIETSKAYKYGRYLKLMNCKKFTGIQISSEGLII